MRVVLHELNVPASCIGWPVSLEGRGSGGGVSGTHHIPLVPPAAQEHFTPDDWSSSTLSFDKLGVTALASNSQHNTIQAKRSEIQNRLRVIPPHGLPEPSCFRRRWRIAAPALGLLNVVAQRPWTWCVAVPLCRTEAEKNGLGLEMNTRDYHDGWMERGAVEDVTGRERRQYRREKASTFKLYIHVWRQS